MLHNCGHMMVPMQIEGRTNELFCIPCSMRKITEPTVTKKVELISQGGKLIEPDKKTNETALSRLR